MHIQPIDLKNNSTCCTTKDNGFFINNRKYLGSKHRLLPFLKKIILKHTDSADIFIDGFAGTGVVGSYFLPYVKKIIANDLLYSNFVILNTFLNSKVENVSLEKIDELLRILNTLDPREGYIYENFSGTYFTGENAGLIDAVRDQIALWYEKGECSEQEQFVLLTSLLYGVDKIANTVGQYDAFLKNLGQKSYSTSGKHMVDYNVYKRITLKTPAISYHKDNHVYCRDLNTLIRDIPGDILYLDPPYNSRQYIDCYHLLENIALWKKPELYGKTKKFKRDHLKSDYSKKNSASGALNKLIEQADAKHIFLSYSNEGIISDKVILEILANKGEAVLYEQPYHIFGNGAGVSVKRRITERIFYCKVKNHQ